MRIHLLGAASELGAAVAEQIAVRGHEVVEADAEVIINVLRQAENSLLHDGWAWKGARDRFPAQTADLLQIARRQSPRLVVDAGYAFLYGEVRDAPETAPQSAPGGNERFAAAVVAEETVRRAGLPVCTLRLGYGYGPRYQDLRRYRTSFNFLRPYYAGPGLPAPWLHHDDAATALLVAAEEAPAGSIFNVADDHPASLREVIDHFGRNLLHRFPYHLPRRVLPLLGGQIRREQVILLDQGTTVDSSAFRRRFGWRPRYPSYREGLAQTVSAWS